MEIDRAAYYSHIRELALIKRAEYSVATGAFGLKEVRAIYRREGIAIDTLSLTPRLKAIYICALMENAQWRSEKICQRSLNFLR
jgi:hypothetical protein